MNEPLICSHCIHFDEAPMVCKPIETLMEDVAPTVEILKVIKPIYNFKAK